MKGSTTPAWNLSPGDGSKTVWVQFKDGEGTLSEPMSGAIQLDTRALPREKSASIPMPLGAPKPMKMGHGAPSPRGERLGVRGYFGINDDAPPVLEGVPVTLALQAEDSGSGLSQMMVSNASNFQGSVWENYSAEKSWGLNPGKGMRTVFVRYRDRAGNISKMFQDNIRVE